LGYPATDAELENKILSFCSGIELCFSDLFLKSVYYTEVLKYAS